MPAARSTVSRREQVRARQQELARTQLLDAAEAVFGEKGIVGSTVKDIAEVAGYSVGWVYTFYDSKDALLAAVMTRRGIEMTEGIARITTAGGPALDRLVDLARYEVEFFTERPAFARLYLRSAAIGPLLPVAVSGSDSQELLERAVRLSCDLIARGQQDGTLCAGPPVVLARVLSGIVTAYQTFAVGEGDPRLLDGFDTDAIAALVRRTFASGAPAPPAHASGTHERTTR
jgi:AcrR family transcriptional regulator